MISKAKVQKHLRLLTGKKLRHDERAEQIKIRKSVTFTIPHKYAFLWHHIQYKENVVDPPFLQNHERSIFTYYASINAYWKYKD